MFGGSECTLTCLGCFWGLCSFGSACTNKTSQKMHLEGNKDLNFPVKTTLVLKFSTLQTLVVSCTQPTCIGLLRLRLLRLRSRPSLRERRRLRLRRVAPLVHSCRSWGNIDSSWEFLAFFPDFLGFLFNFFQFFFDWICKWKGIKLHVWFGSKWYV